MPRRQRVMQDLEHGLWFASEAAPHQALRAHVHRYIGWYERRTSPIFRRELPTHQIPVIISFGAPIRVFDVTDPSRSTTLDGFAAGAYDSHVLVEANGFQGGVQIDFTLLGMRLFLHRPLRELVNQCVLLEDLLGPYARRLTEELQAAPTWDVRFDILDREIARRMDAARHPATEVSCVWTRIVQSGGRVPIGSLVRETGWSQKHLIAQFREHIGLTPKAFARVMRFGRAINRLQQDPRARMTQVALDCGYYDQSHFDRDFRTFAGLTPTELVQSLTAQGSFTSER